MQNVKLEIIWNEPKLTKELMIKGIEWYLKDLQCTHRVTEILNEESIKRNQEYAQQKIDNHSQASKLKEGFVKIVGCDNADGFEKICKESELLKVGKEIFSEHPGEDGYYSFTKYLWIEYPDDRNDVRLDDLVPYDN